MKTAELEKILQEKHAGKITTIKAIVCWKCHKVVYFNIPDHDQGIYDILHEKHWEYYYTLQAWLCKQCGEKVDEQMKDEVMQSTCDCECP